MKAIIDKHANIKQISSNIIFNRFDKLYGDYDIWYLTEQNRTEQNRTEQNRTEQNRTEQEFYIPVYYDSNNKWVYVGLYLVLDISHQLVSYFIKRIKEEYSNVSRIYFNESNYNNRFLRETKSHIINLSQSEEEFRKTMSRSERKHLNQYSKYILRDFNQYSIQKYDGCNIQQELVDLFFEYKKETYKLDSKFNAETFLKNYHISRAYSLEIDGISQAMIFLSITDTTVAMRNLTYNSELSMYHLGTLLYYNMICDLLKENMNVLSLGKGNQEYKYRWGAHNITTYTGYIPTSFIDKSKCIMHSAIINTYTKYIYPKLKKGWIVVTRMNRLKINVR